MVYENIREDLQSYVKTLDKYSGEILRGRVPWDKFRDEEWLKEAEEYIKATHEDNLLAMEVYNALKSYGQVYILMGYALKQKHGNQEVMDVLRELAQETYENIRELADYFYENNYTRIGGAMEAMADKLKDLYERSVAAYLQSEGVYKIPESLRSFKYRFENVDQDISSRLREQESRLEAVLDRYLDKLSRE